MSIRSKQVNNENITYLWKKNHKKVTAAGTLSIVFIFILYKNKLVKAFYGSSVVLCCAGWSDAAL